MDTTHEEIISTHHHTQPHYRSFFENINFVYTESCKLRVYVNILRGNLTLLQEVSLNIAINASKENSIALGNIYKMVAGQIRKNSIDMNNVLDKLNAEIDSLIKTALLGVKKARLIKKLEEAIFLLDDNNNFQNKQKVIETLSNNTLYFNELFKQIKKLVISIKQLHDHLFFLSKKIWLTMANLKIENNVSRDKNSFFVNIAETLDEKSEVMTKQLEEMFQEILKIEGFSRSLINKEESPL